MEMNLDDFVFPNAEHMDGQQQPILQHGWTYNPAYTSWTIDEKLDYPTEQSALWLASDPTYLMSSQQQRFSTSTDSSVISNLRASSNESVFSQWQTRSSMASTDSSYSQFSRVPLEDPQLPIQPPQATSSAEGPTSPAPSNPRRRSAQRQASPEKDAFATCVSRTRRSRRSQREPRYWCTSCEEPFIEKYDWKRHEETYQERRFVFRCGLCSAIYFLEKDFLHHHETRHNCETCQRDDHLEAAKQKRQTRTGWGCGFCTHFSTDWRERCNHIAQHFEKDGKTMRDWRQSDVIQSLLQRPTIREAWCKILQSQRQLRTDFGWNQHNTGRVEGYPENNAEPHLQDLLEYYRPNNSAAALAQLAFLKIAFPSLRPQAPRKDYHDHRTATLPSLMDDQPSWDQLMYTIKEDEISPTGVCQPEYGVFENAFGEHAKMYL
ncbi:homeobox and C2H2 transcription factor [Stagonosporopsis vannaccii]|nr:homeobox and C2H2 transcription factor [Stagonosporopsis vannaccii]